MTDKYHHVELARGIERDLARLLRSNAMSCRSSPRARRARLTNTTTLFEACCEIALDARGRIIDYTPLDVPAPSSSR